MTLELRSAMLLALLPLAACSSSEEAVPAAESGQQDGIGAAAPPPAPDDRRARLMDEIEAGLAMPEGAKPLNRYKRSYAFTRETPDDDQGARERVIGVFVTSPEPGRQWVEDEARLPRLLDGGCRMVRLVFDPAAGKIDWIACNGEA